MGKKNARNIILFRCSKALYFYTFSKMFLSKFTLKNIYMYNTPQICSGMLKIAPKALHFLKFPPSVHSLRRLTPFITPQKNNSCHFYSLIISVYISNVFAKSSCAILVVYLLCIGFTDIVDCFIIIFKYLKEIRSIIINNIFHI